MRFAATRTSTGSGWIVSSPWPLTMPPTVMPAPALIDTFGDVTSVKSMLVRKTPLATGMPGSETCSVPVALIRFEPLTTRSSVALPPASSRPGRVRPLMVSCHVWVAGS